MLLTRDNIDTYILTLGDSKNENNNTWLDIANCINEILRDNGEREYSESFYRKRYHELINQKCSNTGIGNEENINSSQDVDEQTCKDQSLQYSHYEHLLNKIKKERAKLSDERVQNNAYIRAISREENLKDIAIKAVESISREKIFTPNDCINVKSQIKHAILTISDWHYGLICNNIWNEYNPKIAKERISTLLNETITICKANNVSNITVVNLSDLISGRIHLPLRLSNQFDVVTQTMEVSEILAEFLYELSQHFTIDYYDCEDNHSRIEPDKSNSIHLESFTRIITWYLKTRLKNHNKIIIHDNNEYTDDIITFNCGNFRVAAVHGDKDKFSQIVNNITLMTGENFDLILTAHMHHFAAEEVNNTLVIQNGTLMGTDYYATSIRKKSIPSQNLIIASDINVAECIYKIMTVK